jgi:hypothetical protein
MITEQQRTERYQTLRRRGISLSFLASDDLAKDAPPASLRGHVWIAHLWPRPTALTFPRLESLFPQAQRDWDTSETFVTRQSELQAELETKRAAEEKAQAEADTQRRVAEADQIKAELRERYLALPGTNEAGFEREYPTLLADHHRRQMEQLERTDQAARTEMGRLVRSAL